MVRVVRTLRRVAMVTVAVASMAGAGWLIWVFVSREQVDRLSNAHLLAILALMVLPGATLVAWLLDRKAAHEQGESTLEDNGLFERPAGIEVVEEPEPEPKRAVVPDRPARGATRTRQVHQPHRRRGSRSAGRRP